MNVVVCLLFIFYALYLLLLLPLLLLLFFYSLSEIKHLDCLDLSDNRLSATSLPTIIENISYSTLIALDLSFNSMHGTGMQALAGYFKAKTVLQDVDLSNCGLMCSDIKMLCTVLSMYSNHVEELRLSCNQIGEEGAAGKHLLLLLYH